MTTPLEPHLPLPWQVPLVVLVGLLGFLAILGLSTLSVQPIDLKKEESGDATGPETLGTVENNAATTPRSTTHEPSLTAETPASKKKSAVARQEEQKTPLTSTPEDRKLGTTFTPNGRRSTRLMRRRKEN